MTVSLGARPRLDPRALKDEKARGHALRAFGSFRLNARALQ